MGAWPDRVAAWYFIPTLYLFDLRLLGSELSSTTNKVAGHV